MPWRTWYHTPPSRANVAGMSTGIAAACRHPPRVRWRTRPGGRILGAGAGDDSENLMADPEFVRGFAEGALEVWSAVQNQI